MAVRIQIKIEGDISDIFANESDSLGPAISHLIAVNKQLKDRNRSMGKKALDSTFGFVERVTRPSESYVRAKHGLPPKEESEFD